MDGKQNDEAVRSNNSNENSEVDQWERLIRAILQFSGRLGYTFLVTLLIPFSLPKKLASKESWIAPPFSYVVVALFAAGIGISVIPTLEDGNTNSLSSSLIELQATYGDISIWQASLKTFPCVLLVSGIAIAFRRIAGSVESFERDPVVRVTCLVAGTQFLLIAGFSLVATIQTKGVQLSSAQTCINALCLQLYSVMLLATLFGTAAAATVLRIRQPHWSSRTLCRYPLGLALSASTLFGCLALMKAHFDVANDSLKKPTPSVFADIQAGLLTITDQSGESILLPLKQMTASPPNGFSTLEDECVNVDFAELFRITAENDGTELTR